MVNSPWSRGQLVPCLERVGESRKSADRGRQLALRRRARPIHRPVGCLQQILPNRFAILACIAERRRRPRRHFGPRATLGVNGCLHRTLRRCRAAHGVLAGALPCQGSALNLDPFPAAEMLPRGSEPRRQAPVFTCAPPTKRHCGIKPGAQAEKPAAAGAGRASNAILCDKYARLLLT